MKEVKTFIIVDIIVAILKALGGLLCHSYTMLASCLLEVIFIIISLFIIKKKDNKKYKGIISSFIGIIVVLLGLGMIFISVITKVQKVSLWIILFIIVCMLLRYIVGCFYSNINYQKKKGILGYGNINSNMDFYLAGIVLVVLILSKLSKFIDLFKYADIIGTILISGFVIIKGIRIIKKSFYRLEDKEIEFNGYEEEIKKRSEVKNIVSIDTIEFGGFAKAKCNIVLNSNLSMMDLNTFVVSLQDYFLKKVDAVEINLLEDVKPKKTKKPKVRSLKQDARNSRSGNSKTNTKKKNSTKKNKKR